MKVRIFALAKELGLANKELIDLCNDAGIAIKNSALASITAEEREIVVNFVKGQGKPKPAASTNEPVAPVRKTPPAEKKIRAIPAQRSKAEADELEADVAAEVAAETPAAEETAAPPVEAAPVAEVSETPDAAVEAVAAEADTTAADKAAKPTAPAADTDTAAKPAADDSDDATATATPADPAPATGDKGSEDTKKPGSPAVKREDYMPAGGGATRQRSVREMRPIGSVRESDARKKPQKKAALPSIAAPPAYKPPVQKTVKAEETAQKPDMMLTPEVLDGKQSPLADRLRTNRDDGGSGGGKRKSSSGGLIARRNRERQTQRQNQQLNQRRRGGRGNRRRRQTGPIQHKTEATVEVPITVRSLSEAMGRPAKQIQSELFKRGTMSTINDLLDEDTAEEIALELGVELTFKRGRDMEDVLAAMVAPETDEALLSPRPPIITVLGHVDHGKTTLVDRIRQANVAGGEAGGITQHIAAYQTEHEGRPITFVDTPGHAAFGEMRARGANVTDIIVLVVAADDGIMPQTKECISHAKEAGVPIIVAMNKCDLPEYDEQRVLQGLAAEELLPAEWGGDTEVVKVSALKGDGIDDLLETILLTAELQDYKTNAECNASGICLEAFRDEGRGPLAWFMVQKGTLRVGDIVLCGTTFGRIRAMYNDRDEELAEAPPSMPVKVAGLEAVPGAGQGFFNLDTVEEAREIAEDREHAGRSAMLTNRNKPMTMEQKLALAASGIELQELPLIVKADSPGSIEALRGEINKFEHPEVAVRIVHEGVGGVNESDVYLASTTGAIIIAFHVIAEDKAAILADNEGVEIRRYSIIYEIAGDIRGSLEGLLKPEEVTVTTGRALVLKTFSISRFGTIAGCRVLSGTIQRDNRMHVIRDQKVLNDYRISSLKREKEDAKEVRDGMECGIRLDGFNDVREGDLLEAFRIDHVPRTLDDK